MECQVMEQAGYVLSSSYLGMARHWRLAVMPTGSQGNTGLSLQAAESLDVHLLACCKHY